MAIIKYLNTKSSIAETVLSIHFLLGGARSGKSSYAEALAFAQWQKQGGTLHYIATATPFDDEMRHRIEMHQERRGCEWSNHECPHKLSDKLAEFSSQDIVLIDCLTLWLNNVIYNDGDTATPEMIEQEVKKLASALSVCPAKVYCVSNEVGLGIIPLGEVTRLYVDHAGWMNQAVAKVAQEVTFMAAGLPMVLKTKQ